ncbi:MAG TPA: HAD-IA family hydrolase [Acidimicrobiia bacterium]|nr:HAD-IA family hydrolase [Acidimicrobiia bacterium]
MKALLLDVGGVVIRHAFELRHRAEAVFGLPAGTLDRGGPFGPTPDPDWDLVEAGKLVEQEYWTAWTAEIGRHANHPDLTIRELWLILYGGDESEFIRPETMALAQEVAAAGAPVAMLSNDLTAFHGADWVAGVIAFRDIGPLLDAVSLGARKPEPAAYAAATARLGVPPSNVVFTDDLEDNTRGAEAAGLSAVRFDIADPRGSIARIRAALSTP